jgi:outer membrane protein assembly factor BamB
MIRTFGGGGAILLLLLGIGASGARAPGVERLTPQPAALVWTTHRGNPARTGNLDGQAGPGRPKVLWVHASTEQYVASLVAVGDRLFTPALGAFGTASFHAFDLADQPAKRIAWTKAPPLLRGPSVCAPVLFDGKLVLGEGMHQTDGGALLCLRASDGRVVWRLDVPGELVHLEGSPTVDQGRIVLGAGSAGILSIDPSRVTIQGKEMGTPDAERELDRKWKELEAAYLDDKKKNPDFAIPPNEMGLPQAAPRTAWTQGRGVWHVDGPTAVAEGRVLAGSAYLDKEKKGERVLVCLAAEDGKVIWKTPLKFNPWGGPSVLGGRVVVSTSSIRYDPQEVAGAKGEVVAVRLSDGHVEWTREVDGGVLCSAALVGDLVVVTDTGGHTQALDAKTGAPRWVHTGGSPFFAGATVSKEVVYVADLKGCVSALGLGDGKSLWSLELGASGGSAGMVYGSPVLLGGRLYVATSTLGGGGAGQPTAVTCIGAP